MGLKEYKPGTAFPGVIGRTTDESSPAWPQPVRAVPGAPNVLVVVLDDTGFGQLGCYGSPIATPNLDALAANGLRYNNMHTTALCSPSRSCIITGRNHHSNAMAAITELASGYPGYNGVMGGDTSQWYPELVYDNHQVEPPRTPEEGYHLSEDLVDKAMEFISDVRQVDPARP